MPLDRYRRSHVRGRYSLGGGVALQMGRRHPALVHKLVVVSASSSTDGAYPDAWAGTENVFSAAEGEGFEPPGLITQGFSRASQSAALPSLRAVRVAVGSQPEER
jgi:pimeloyl-ACP methyl ester carboxylesterase